MVISGTSGAPKNEVEQRLLALDRLTDNLMQFSVAPSTNLNHRTREKRYLQYCFWFEQDPYPVTEFQLMRYATYLSLSMQSVDSIKQYCNLVCDLHELKGYKPVRKTKRYRKTIDGIKRQLQHEVSQARPLSLNSLKRMINVVDMTNNKELAAWVGILTGFFLFLRKSNLVPDTRQHENRYQMSRQDVKVDDPVMVFVIKWAKNNQFGKKLQIPVVRDDNNVLCLATWIQILTNRCPAQPQHNLISYTVGDQVLPLTYNELTFYLRKWLADIGEPNPEKYTSHSLRRGGTTHAFNNGVPEQTVKVLGNWASQCYRRYIEITVEMRLQAWETINLDLNQ